MCIIRGIYTFWLITDAEKREISVFPGKENVDNELQ